VVHAKEAQRLPVVLTRAEVGAVLRELRGVPQLVALLLYGSGLRLHECLRLRVKDVDFGRSEIRVRHGKGGGDRVTHTLYLTDGHLRTEVYVEDWTKSVARAGNHWDLASLAENRALSSCMADGPDCSTSCKMRQVEEIPNAHGVRVVAVIRRRFDTCEHPDTARSIDPLYVADLSGGGTYRLLILGSQLDEPGVPVETVRSIVATIRRVGNQPK
jgi:integrase-like protein